MPLVSALRPAVRLASELYIEGSSKVKDSPNLSQGMLSCGQSSSAHGMHHGERRTVRVSFIQQPSRPQSDWGIGSPWALEPLHDDDDLCRRIVASDLVLNLEDPQSSEFCPLPDLTTKLLRSGS